MHIYELLEEHQGSYTEDELWVMKKRGEKLIEEAKNKLKHYEFLVEHYNKILDGVKEELNEFE